jgi:hypothetical protein
MAASGRAGLTGDLRLWGQWKTIHASLASAVQPGVHFADGCSLAALWSPCCDSMQGFEWLVGARSVWGAAGAPAARAQSGLGHGDPLEFAAFGVFLFQRYSFVPVAPLLSKTIMIMEARSRSASRQTGSSTDRGYSAKAAVRQITNPSTSQTTQEVDDDCGVSGNFAAQASTVL